MNADPDIHFTNSYLDFVSLFPIKDVEEILSEKSKLNILHEFIHTSDEEVLKKFLNCFNGGVITIPIDLYHATSNILDNPDKIISAIKIIQGKNNCTPLLYYTYKYFKSDKDYFKTLKYILVKTGCCLYRTDIFLSDAPVPDKTGSSSASEFDRCYQESNGEKYVKLNILCRIALLMNRFLSESLILKIRVIIYKLLNNSPIILKSICKKC